MCSSFFKSKIYQKKRENRDPFGGSAPHVLRERFLDVFFEIFARRAQAPTCIPTRKIYGFYQDLSTSQLLARMLIVTARM